MLSLVIEFLGRNWRVVVVALLVGWAGLATKWWRETARDFRDYKVKQQDVADAAKAQYDQTVEDVSNAWNNALPSVRSGAVNAYCRTHACGMLQQPPGGGQAVSPQGTDAATQESVPCDPDFDLVRDAAEDALKVLGWQSWAKENQLPVK